MGRAELIFLKTWKMDWQGSNLVKGLSNRLGRTRLLDDFADELTGFSNPVDDSADRLTGQRLGRTHLLNDLADGLTGNPELIKDLPGGLKRLRTLLLNSQKDWYGCRSFWSLDFQSKWSWYWVFKRIWSGFWSAQAKLAFEAYVF